MSLKIRQDPGAIIFPIWIKDRINYINNLHFFVRVCIYMYVYIPIYLIF